MPCKFLHQAPWPGVESIATHFLQANVPGEPHEEVVVVTEAAELAPLAAVVVMVIVIVVVPLSATILTGCDGDLASS